MQLFPIINKGGDDKCRCECKELVEKGICDKGFIWNSNNCELECDQSRDVREYLDYENCKCSKKLIDKLVEECSENINEKELHSSEMIYNLTLNDYKKVCSSCTIYIALFVIFLIVSTSISCVFIHFHRYFKKSSTNITNINPGTKTVIS